MAKESKPEVTLADIQALVKVPKSSRNTFGNYNFRSASDILETVKPIVNPLGFSVTLGDEIVNVGGSNYVKSTATLSNGILTYSESALAREENEQKGMQAPQITGSTSSYARKYALSGLFAIDDTKDPDATNDHGKGDTKAPEAPKKPKPPTKPETPKAPVSKPTLNPQNKQWEPTIEKLKNGVTIETVKSFFTISPEDEQELIKLSTK